MDEKDEELDMTYFDTVVKKYYKYPEFFQACFEHFVIPLFTTDDSEENIALCTEVFKAFRGKYIITSVLFNPVPAHGDTIIRLDDFKVDFDEVRNGLAVIVEVYFTTMHPITGLFDLKGSRKFNLDSSELSKLFSSTTFSSRELAMKYYEENSGEKND